jgi:hypothetical protein
MSNSSNRDSSPSTVRGLRFTHWPLRDEPLRAGILMLVATSLAGLAGWSWHSGWVALGAWAALAGCLWKLWLPVHYEFALRGITQTVLGRSRRISWRDVAACEFRPRGVFLYATEDTSPLASFRSLFVRYPAQREQLRELIEAALARPAPRGSSSVEVLIAPPPAEQPAETIPERPAT